MEDKDILDIYKEGKKDYAFNLITRKYSERLYWHLRKLLNSHEDTNDILQDTLIKVWKNLPNYRGDSKIYTWMYRIATNEAITFLKRQQLKNKLLFKKIDNENADDIIADPTFSGDKAQADLQVAINALPPKQRAVFSLRYFDEMKYDDMVEILGGTTGSLKASYHHAYNKVKDHLLKVTNYE